MKGAKAKDTQGREAQNAGDSLGAREQRGAGEKEGKKHSAWATPAQRGPNKEEGHGQCIGDCQLARDFAVTEWLTVIYRYFGGNPAAG